ncbi:MAG TPA: type I glyceraldehyde-3-phosphate dehydrogenase [Candidatus Nanoarchaeia archaeon]|nr:type I glyceraldehyde-3-phosphate dehydrogenase [Candidatus Nanoarchaeia archaeon]
MVRVAINGFGRIGRQILQAGINDPDIEWIAVNDLTDTKTLAHLLKYDSVHGVSPYSINYDEKNLIVNSKTIKVFAEKDPTKLPWKDLKIDIVVESTGFFTERDGAMQHIKAGAKKVLISSPGKNSDITIVLGVNEKEYDKKKHNIISNASCTTNCLAPIVKVLNDNLSVKRGFMVTAHSYTADQRLVDAPHKDLRRARSAAVSIIPTVTGAAKALGDVIPDVKGKMDGFAWRVPTPDGSIVNVVVEVEKPTDIEKVNWLFKQVAQYHMKGILEYTEEPIVSRDIIHNPHSCIFDALSTNVLGGTLISVSGWYDNEWGYSCRMVDVIKLL